MSDRRWVGQHEPAAHRGIKGVAQHRVDLEDALVVEAARAFGTSGVAKLCVETLEVVDAQMPHWDASDGGHDMQLDVASVAIPCAGAQRQLLDRQPALCEVDRDRETASVWTVGRTRCRELRRQYSCLCLAGARGMPASPLAAR